MFRSDVRKSTRVLVSVGFGASLLLIFVIGFLSYQSLTELIDANRWVEHTYQVLGELDAFQDSILKVERRVNGSGVSGEHPDLGLFQSSSASLRGEFSTLRRLTADNVSQQDRLNQLDSLITERLQLLRRSIELRTASHPEIDQESTVAGQGAQVAARIRAIVTDMKAEEESLLSERNRTTRADAHRAIAAIAASSLAAFLLVLVATISVNRNMSRREHAEERARRHSRRREVLRSIDLAILSAHSLREIADTVLDRIQDLLPYQRASVMIFDDPEHSEGRVIAARGGEGTRTDTESLVPSENFGDIQILRSGHAQIQESASAHSDPSHPHLSGSQLCVPLMVDESLVGVFRLGNDRPEVFTPEYQDTAGELATSLAVAFQGALLLERLEIAHDRLEMMSRRLLEAEETERRRLAQDLHDELGQTLTAISLRLQLLEKRLGDSEFAAQVDETVDVVQRASEQVRNLALNLRPPSLDDVGLVRTLGWYVEHQAQWGGLAGRFRAEPPEISLPPHLETTCFRVVQEALTNAMRHSRAHRIDVELRQDEGEVELLIRDDGAGFDVEATMKKAEAGSGFGLLGMDERVRLANGRFSIESGFGSGTIVRANFSLPRQAAETQP